MQSLEDLPLELLFESYKYLSYDDLINLSAVNRTFRKYSQDQYIQNIIDMRKREKDLFKHLPELIFYDDFNGHENLEMLKQFVNQRLQFQIYFNPPIHSPTPFWNKFPKGSIGDNDFYLFVNTGKYIDTGLTE